MIDTLDQSRCTNIFQSNNEEDMSDNFTKLWVLVINNQENNKLVTMENNVLQADVKEKTGKVRLENR